LQGLQGPQGDPGVSPTLNLLRVTQTDEDTIPATGPGVPVVFHDDNPFFRGTALKYTTGDGKVRIDEPGVYEVTYHSVAIVIIDSHALPNYTFGLYFALENGGEVVGSMRRKTLNTELSIGEWHEVMLSASTIVEIPTANVLTLECYKIGSGLIKVRDTTMTFRKLD
jgi:hypothetical protein